MQRNAITAGDGNGKNLEEILDRFAGRHTFQRLLAGRSVDLLARSSRAEVDSGDNEDDDEPKRPSNVSSFP